MGGLIEIDLGWQGFGQMDFGKISRFGIFTLEGIWGLGFSDLWGIWVLVFHNLGILGLDGLIGHGRRWGWLEWLIGARVWC